MYALVQARCDACLDECFPGRDADDFPMDAKCAARRSTSLVGCDHRCGNLDVDWGMAVASVVIEKQKS